MIALTRLLIWPLAVLAVSASAADLSGVTCSWVGNSLPGIGANGHGKWVTNDVDEIEVTPDGVVISQSAWDESGRCIGLYRDGDVNGKLLQQYNGKGGHKAWGWGTAGGAVAVAGNSIFAVNTEGELMRFSWQPPDLDSAIYVDQQKVGKAVGLNARGKLMAVVLEGGAIQLRSTTDLGQTGSLAVPGATDLAIDDAGSLWVLAGTTIRHYRGDGTALPEAITDLEKPSAVSIDPKGRLLVCEDGRRQQVLIYDLTDAPKLVRSFGEEGGLRTGRPGEAKPGKLFALRGAGADRDGNLYVALGFGSASGGLVLRSFTPDGALRWELAGLAFVSCFDVDPASDGRIVYGSHGIFDLDLDLDSRKEPGKEWRLRATTVDHLANPNDPRLKGDACTAIVRHLQGRRLLYTTGQMCGGFQLYSFTTATGADNGDLARPVGRVGKDGWAWEVDSDGAIWRGDAPKSTIQRYPFAGWQADGTPKYDLDHPESWPRPDGFSEVARVKYIPQTDTLYVAGYTPELKAKSWGLIGSVVTRYDGWMKGEKKKRWTAVMPLDDEQLAPKSFDVAGDYLFAVMVKPTKGVPALVHVLKTADGGEVGTMHAGPEVGGNSGWVDQSHGLRAFKRADGEYLVLVEEDWRAKNLLYRWRPTAK